MKGIFLDGSVTGLAYFTPSHQGILDSDGKFEYKEGEAVVFLLGSLTLGSCLGKPVVTPLDLVSAAVGRHLTVSHYQVQNMARLLLGIENITDSVIEAVNKVYTKINFMQEPERFENDPAIIRIFRDLGKSLAPKAKTNNLVRRCANNIRKESNVKIPVRDGSYVMATVYRPLSDGKYPVVMSMGAFGRDFVMGFSMGDEERKAYLEEAEDKFYDDYGNLDTKRMLQGVFFDRLGPCFASNPPVPNVDPKQPPMAPPEGPPPNLVPISEAFEQPCAMDWVPYGYCVINVDERGVGDSPDKLCLKQFGNQNAEDYYDAIEWAATQPWSSGRIGLFGASYYAMTQYQVAWRKPKGLSAMIPIMGDYDSYRDYVYSGGGLLNIADNMTLSAPEQQYTMMTKAGEEPFWNEETYGPYGEYMASAKLDEIDIPIFPSTEPDASLHGKGSSEAYINCPSENKKYMLVNSTGIHFWMYHPEYMAKFRAFFDHWLKGADNGIMDEPRVDIQIRCGNGSYIWRHESDWPVPETQYQKFYLNAVNDGSVTSGNGLTDPFDMDKCLVGSLDNDIPTSAESFTYDADVPHRIMLRVPGTTFVSEPFAEDTQIAGYIKAGLYVSSTTEDMELHLRVRVLDENNNEVNYTSDDSMEPLLPVGFGALLASHRELDPERSRDYLPVYKHTRESHKSLKPGEVVYCEVGTFPTSALIKKGWKLRIDIDPVNWRWVNYNEEVYRKGSENTIYTGTEYPSFVQIPVLP